MARGKRRRRREGNRLLFWGIPVLVLCAAIGFMYLHLHGTCEALGRDIKRLEVERAELRKQVGLEEHNWEAARSIRHMDQLMAQHGIVMSFPEERDIIRLRAVNHEAPVELAMHRRARPHE